MALDLSQFLPRPWPRDPKTGDRIPYAKLSEDDREHLAFQAMEHARAVLDHGWDGRIQFKTHKGALLIDTARPRKKAA